MFNPLPAVALLPLALLWFGIGMGSLIFVIVHSVLWAVALNTHAGFQSVSDTLRMAGRNIGLGGLSLVSLVLIPAALPSIISGLKIGWAFGWRTLIAAELVFGVSSGQGGLGWFILENRNNLETANDVRDPNRTIRRKRRVPHDRARDHLSMGHAEILTRFACSQSNTTRRWQYLPDVRSENAALAEIDQMDFGYSENQDTIRDAITRICSGFDDAYWLKKDREGGFPHDFHKALADDGWLGICVPEAYGGSGLGITEAAIMMRAIAESGAGMSGASAVHINVFGLNPVVVFGTETQRKRMLPPMVEGKEKTCFNAVEDARGGPERPLHRQWTKGLSTARIAQKILLLARTTPLENVRNPTHGLSIFYTDFDRTRIKVHEIEKMGRKSVDSNELFFEDFEIPVEDRIGEEGRGLEYILEGMNPERILIAAEAVGLAKLALARAADYAKTRIVFNRPIGMKQAIQHPLAGNWVELEAAWLMVMSAAWQYDRWLPCGAAANAAKYLAGEAGFRACEQAVMTHGGFGYAKEFHVERYLREIMIPRIAPVSPQLALSFIAEKVLGLPKSY
jgi:acyl-CoA dehydrogenase